MNKNLITYFVEEVKEKLYLQRLYKATVIDHEKFLQVKPKTLKRGKLKIINYVNRNCSKSR
jgi:hypothetical protein